MHNTFNRFVDHYERTILFAVLLLATGILITHALHAPIESAGPDGVVYEHLGYQAAIDKHLFSCGNFMHAYRSPTWVTIIAIIYRIFGREPRAIRVFLITVALGTAALVYFTAKKLAFGRSALISVLLFLFSHLVYQYTSYYQYEILLGFLIVLAGFLLFHRDHKKPAGSDGSSSQNQLGIIKIIIAGIVAGLAALISPRVVILLPLLVFLLYLQGKWRYVLRALPLFVAGLLITIIPWTVRNYQCYGEWILTTTNGGVNFYMGNNARSTGGYYMPPEGIRPDYPVHDSWSWTRDALTYMASHPMQTIGRSLWKGIRFWIPHYGDQILIFALFWLGWYRFLRKKDKTFTVETIWVMVVPFMFMLVHMFFYVQVRYTLPVLPFVCIFGGAGLWGWSPHENV